MEKSIMFFRLSYVELKKQLNKSTIFIFFIIIIFSVSVLGFNISNAVDYSMSGEDWKTRLETEILNIDLVISNNNSISDYARNELIANRLIYQYRLDNDIMPTSDHSVSNLFLSSNMLFPIIAVFTLIISTRVITDDFNYDSYKLLITAPFKRWKILASKLMTVLLIPFLSIILLYLFSFLLGLYLYGGEEVNTIYLYAESGMVKETSYVIVGLKSIMFNIFKLYVLAMFSVTIALFTKKTLITIVSTLAIFFTSSLLNSVFFNWKLFKYLFIAYFDSLSLYNNSLYNRLPLLQSIFLMSTYLVIFIIIAIWRFSRIDFS